MDQKKLPFRFKIPWISQTSLFHCHKKKSKLPFRPPGIAPVQKTHSPSSSSSSSSSTSHNQPMKLLQNPKPDKSEGQVSGRRQVAEPPLGTASPGGKNQQESPQETVETRMMLSTSKVSNVSCTSHQKPPLQKEMKEDVSNCDYKLETADDPLNVTTLAGDNRGATMNIGSKSGRKVTLIPIYRAYKKNPEQRYEVADDDGDESSEEDSGNSVENEIGNAYVNSNMQSLNNSLMCQSSINDRDPGVHLKLPQKEFELVKRDDKRGPEIRKPEVNVGRNDGVRIRRRCLRGLLAEPSDSDPDNPNKPQRHGCKYKCGNDI